MSDEEKEKRLHAAGGGADTYESVSSRLHA